MGFGMLSQIILYMLFGRYRWKCMLFWILFVFEVFQRKMEEFVEGLIGIEVVVDDFLVVDYGESYEEVIMDYDKNFLKFFSCCE